MKTYKMYDQVYIGLGSNIEPRFDYIQGAAKCIALLDNTEITHRSRLYESEPIGNANQLFFNAVIRVKTILSPEELMKKLLAIEEQLGRIRIVKGGNRTIDCDLLFFDHIIVTSSFLCLPHPEIQNRDFVLRPLNDIDPTFIHPLYSKSIATLLNGLVVSTSLKPLNIEW